MGTCYDSGLYDEVNLAWPFNEGYNNALRKLTLEIRVCCPVCETSLETTKQQLSVIVHPLETLRCLRSDMFVNPSIHIGASHA